MRRVRVMVFDSGVGGVGVARALRRLLPEAWLVYVMDDSGFPYGRWEEEALANRVLAVVGKAVMETAPDLVVIACNTASTLALARLRGRFALPFVGCVPPVRWAARVTRTGTIAVLATKATARGTYLHDLQRAHAPDCRMVVHGSAVLAGLAERRFAGLPVDAGQVAREIAAFAEQEIDAVALGCTHYALLLPEMRACLPETVAWLDPAPAVARQAARVAAELGCGQTPACEPLLLHTRPQFAWREGWAEAGFSPLQVRRI